MHKDEVSLSQSTIESLVLQHTDLIIKGMKTYVVFVFVLVFYRLNESCQPSIENLTEVYFVLL